MSNASMDAAGAAAEVKRHRISNRLLITTSHIMLPAYLFVPPRHLNIQGTLLRLRIPHATADSPIAVWGFHKYRAQPPPRYSRREFQERRQKTAGMSKGQLRN